MKLSGPWDLPSLPYLLASAEVPDNFDSFLEPRRHNPDCSQVRKHTGSYGFWSTYSACRIALVQKRLWWLHTRSLKLPVKERSSSQN